MFTERSQRGGSRAGRRRPPQTIPNLERTLRVLLIEHGANRGGLAAARALSRAGWTVDVLGSGAGLTRRSRAANSWTAVDYPACGDDGLVDAVSEAVQRCGSDLVMPVDETQLLTLSEHRDRLGAQLPYPAHQVLETATDRLAQARIGELAGLAPPKTVAATEARLDDPLQSFVIKARWPRLHLTDSGWSRLETSIGSGDEAREWIDEIARAGGQAIVQERVSGPLSSMTVLTGSDRRLIAQVQQQSTRIWPPAAGTSARASTVAVDPDLSRRVLAFLEALDWHGLAQLQFLSDADGVRRLIDFNPRFYGSLSLAIGAGVDFPSLWADAATGRQPSRPVTGRTGVRYQWLGGDLRRALRERRGGLVRDLGGSLRWGASAVWPVWSLRDPAPAVQSGLRLLANRI